VSCKKQRNDLGQTLKKEVFLIQKGKQWLVPPEQLVD
jgi:hypothetical protein